MTTNITSISPEIEVIPLLPLPFGQSWYIKFNYCVTNHRLKHLFPLKEIAKNIRDQPRKDRQHNFVMVLNIVHLLYTLYGTLYSILYTIYTTYTIWY